ncbi:hypothetical protein [Reinekea thalattae]|nr:hypothetical protein [Reinekea thalattae]
MKNIKQMAKKQKNNKPKTKPLIMQPIAWTVKGALIHSDLHL